MTSPNSGTWILTALTLNLIQTPLIDSGFDRCTERRLGPAATELCYKNILHIRGKVSCRDHKLWLKNGIDVGKASDMEYSIVGDCISLQANPRPEDCSIERDVGFQEEIVQCLLIDSGFDRCTERRLGPAATELCYKNILHIRGKVLCRDHKLWLKNGINARKTSDMEYSIVGDCIIVEANPRPEDCSIERDVAFHEEIVQCLLIDGRPDSPKTFPPKRRTNHFTTFWLSTVQYSGLSLGLLGCSFALYCNIMTKAKIWRTP